MANTQISASILAPGFYAALDMSRAGTGSPELLPLLLIGHKTPAGTATADSVVSSIASEAQADTLFGRGSQLARMYRQARYNNALLPIDALVVPEPSGARASGSITLSGTATAAGTVSLYVGHSLLQPRIDAEAVIGSTAAQLAAALRAAANTYGSELSSGTLTVGQAYEITAHDSVSFTADGAAANTVGTIFWATSATITLSATDKVRPVSTRLPVLAQVLAGSEERVDFIAQHKGICGKDYQIELGLAGEELPAGIIASITAMTGGTGSPTISWSAVGDTEYLGWASAFSDSASIESVQAELTRRFGPTVQVYGHAFCAARGSAEINEQADELNTEHVTLRDCSDLHSPADEACAALVANDLNSLSADAAVPIWTLQVDSLTPKKKADRLLTKDFSKVNTALSKGVSPVIVVNGKATNNDVVTLYKRNSAGVADNSMSAVTTMYTSWGIMKFKRQQVLTQWPRVKLVSDATQIKPGALAVKPRMVRDKIYELHLLLADLGLVQEYSDYASLLSVSQSSTVFGRLDIVDPEKLASGLKIWAYTLQPTLI